MRSIFVRPERTVRRLADSCRRKTGGRRFAVLLGAIGALGWILSPAAMAATLQVCPSGCTYSSIQSAINAAQTGDTIAIAAGTYAENLHIGSPVAAKTLTLNGAAAPQTIVDGGQQDCVLQVDIKYSAAISGITFKNGNCSTAGGIFNDGSLTLTNVMVTANQGVLAGGIGNDIDGRVALFNSTVSNNNSGENTGGIISDGAMTLSNVTISHNQGSQVGGFANDIDGTVIVAHSIVSDNAAQNPLGGEGGGFLNFGAAVFTKATVSGNSATVEGGGIENRGQLWMDNSRISKNTISGVGVGGGLDNRNNLTTFTVTATAILNHTTIDQNGAFSGGGVFNNDAIVELDEGSILDNTAQAGGGLENSFGATMTVANSHIAHNVATVDGGGIINDRGTLTVEHSSIIENQAASKSGAKAGGLGAFGGTVHLTRSPIAFNSASGPIGGLGGGITVTDNAKLTLTRSPVIGNSASTTGGGIYVFSGIVDLQASPVKANQPNNCVGVPGC